MERRKPRGFGAGVPRKQDMHSKRVEKAVADTLAARQQLRATVVDPRLIVRVRTAGFVSEEEWERVGLAILGQDDGEAVVLFSSDGD